MSLHLKILFCILAAVLPLSTRCSGSLTEEEILSAFQSAQRSIEDTEVPYSKLHNYLLMRYREGAENLTPQEWDEVVEPLGKEIEKGIRESMQTLSVVRYNEKGDLRRLKSYQTDFLKRYQLMEYLADLFGDLKHLESDYLMAIGRYNSYVEMYLSIVIVKHKELWSLQDGAKQILESL